MAVYIDFYSLNNCITSITFSFDAMIGGAQ